MNKYLKSLIKIWREFDKARSNFAGKFTLLVYVNFLLIFLQLAYIQLRYSFLNAQIPVWYTKLWGDAMLAPRSVIFIIPFTSFVILISGLVVMHFSKYFIRYFHEIIHFSTFASLVLLSIALIRIIRVASVPFKPLVDPMYISLALPFILGFVGVYVLLPIFIEFANEKKLITNPLIHKAPAMILTRPSARGGGFIFAIVTVVLGLLYVGFDSKFGGVMSSVIFLALIGLFDDYQNTHPSSKATFLENPLIRLVLLFVAVAPTVLSGIKITFIGNLTGGMIFFGEPMSTIITFFWIVWILNALSWSNGVDGQYSGIIGIALTFVAILSLRFERLETVHWQIAILAAIGAGAAFGFTKHTWHPSKVMWGFSAMSAGLLLSALSISTQSKIVTSLLIILVPFLDAVVTFSRRVMQKKNPLSGDRGHLHHLLLERGWKPAKIALFYWGSTAVLGCIGLIATERHIIQTTLVLAGIIASGIVVLNVRSIKRNGKTLNPNSTSTLK